MKIKQTIKTLMLGVTILSSAYLLAITPAYAATSCAGVPTSIINCTQSGTGTDIKDSGVWGLLLLVINILTAGVGIAAVGGIIYGSIMYTTAEGSADKVSKARGIITNVVIGLIAYALMFSFLNFIIPGGLFT